jgi:ferredoxin-like protein FixX
MSKSLGNTIIVDELGDKVLPYRLFISMQNYRNQVNFTDELFESYVKDYDKIKRAYLQASFTLDVNNVTSNENDEEVIKAFEEHMNDDFNTQNVYTIILQLVKDLNVLIRSKDYNGLAIKFNTLDLILDVFNLKFEYKKLTEEEGMKLGLEIMAKLNEYTEKWKKAEDIGYGIYGTPLESTTYKFAKCLQKRFGIIKDITDHGYITNSYHVNVRENIDAFTKLNNEAKFQLLSTGGAISYVEVPDMQHNIEAVLAIIKHIYENIIYAELNTKSDYCMKCGFDGEIKIITDENGKLDWECPKSGNRDKQHLSVVRRTCGYLGANFFN